MWEAINNFLVAVDDKVWGVPLMVLIIAGGVFLPADLGSFRYVVFHGSEMDG